MNQDLIVCQGLGKTFSHTKALVDVNLNIGRGKLVGLLGPNGSGKTTLIKLLCGLLQPSFGSLTINGYTPGVETKAHVSYLPDRMYCWAFSRTSTRILTEKRQRVCAPA